MSLDDLYQELLLDHFKNPRCAGALQNPDCNCSMRNPLCGDNVELNIKFKDKTISEVAFSGHGCSISQASASLMSELIKGKEVIFAESAGADFRLLMGGQDPKNPDALGDVMALAGVRKFSARIRCALLAWEALAKCLSERG